MPSLYGPVAVNVNTGALEYASAQVTQDELDAHDVDTTSVHGITTTAQLAVKNAAQEFTATQTIHPSTDTVAVIVQGASGATVDFLQVKNHAGTVFVNVDENGRLGINAANPGQAFHIGSGFARFDSDGIILNSGAKLYTTGTGTVFVMSGTGSPEGVVTGAVGSLFTRTDGGASTTLYVKESGAGNTGWIAK